MLSRFALAPSDRRALAIVVLALALITAGLWWSADKSAPEQTATPRPLGATYTPYDKEKAGEGNRGLTPFPFDPNTADRATLLRLGLKEWQVDNILKYRAKGGRWRSAEHFGKLYGLTASDHARLSPYIIISPTPAAPTEASRPEPPIYEKVEKLAPGTTLDLNEADTSALKTIPGIGSYYARKIAEYRSRLGGFVSSAQLGEVEGLPEGIESWFRLTPGFTPEFIDINKADFRTLIRHPYFNEQQVKSIMRYRRDYGSLRTLRQLSMLPGFTEEDVERLRDYFVVEEGE